MILSITYLKLKSPLKFITFLKHVFAIMKDLRESKCKKIRTSGFLTKHYTMSLWENEADMRSFASKGAHLTAMKASSSFTSEIAVHSMQADDLLPWNEAKRILKENGRFTYH